MTEEKKDDQRRTWIAIVLAVARITMWIILLILQQDR